jgi:hypothetical protein
MSVVEGQPNQALIRALVVADESEPSDFLARMADDFARYFQDRLRVVAFYKRRQSATVAVGRAQFSQFGAGSFLLIMVSRGNPTARCGSRARPF